MIGHVASAQQGIDPRALAGGLINYRLQRMVGIHAQQFATELPLEMGIRQLQQTDGVIADFDMTTQVAKLSHDSSAAAASEHGAAVSSRNGGAAIGLAVFQPVAEKLILLKLFVLLKHPRIGVTVAWLDLALGLERAHLQHARIVVGPHFNQQVPEPAILRVALVQPKEGRVAGPLQHLQPDLCATHGELAGIALLIVGKQAQQADIIGLAQGVQAHQIHFERLLSYLLHRWSPLSLSKTRHLGGKFRPGLPVTLECSTYDDRNRGNLHLFPGALGMREPARAAKLRDPAYCRTTEEGLMRRTAGVLLALTLLLTTLSTRAESLSDIYELALANDAQLKAEEAQYRANLEREKLERAALLPQLNANYDYTDTDQTNIGESFSVGDDIDSGGVTAIQTRTETDTTREGYQVSLNQALFDLPAWFSFRAGKEFSKQAEATFAANQQNLILRVVEAYLAVLRAQDNLEASRAQERAFGRQLEQTQQRFEVGLIAITDVYEAQAARDLAEVNRIVDENNVSVALENLSVLTGREHSSVNLLKKDFTAEPPQPTDRAAWVDFALNNNFNLQAARHAEEVARQTARANKMEHAPRISGNYTYSDYDTDGTLRRMPSTGFDTSPAADFDESSWQIRLDIPLFSGGAASANRRRAAEEFNVARQNRINLARNTVTDARSLHMTVISDVSRVAARAQAIVSSQSALDATQAGYEVGTRNVVDVLNAQNTLFAAQRDYANSRYDYIINSLRLKDTAGLLSPEDVYELDESLQEPPAPTATGTP